MDQLGKIKQDLKKIVNMLLLNGTLTECPGLVDGKMGIATFFFYYAKNTENEFFADYAMDLINETLNQIHVNSPADYKKGLAGIGVGIDYMIRNEFLKVEDDICEDFDQRMVRAVMYDPLSDFSLYDGLTGFGRYWMTRLRYKTPSEYARTCLSRIVALIEENFQDISKEEQTDVFCFLYDLQKNSGLDLEAIQKRISNAIMQCGGIANAAERLNVAESGNSAEHCFLRLGDSITGNIVRMYQRQYYYDSTQQEEINAALMQIPDLDLEKVPENTGLLNGYAGQGMLRLSALHHTDMSWMLLL